MKKKTSPIIILERSALSAYEIFSKNLKDNKNMSEWEFSLLSRYYYTLTWQPEYYLYLRCDANTSCERIKIRNRNGENNVPEELIQQLHDRHENLFLHSRHEKNIPKIAVIDANHTMEQVTKDAIKLLNKIERCIDV